MVSFVGIAISPWFRLLELLAFFYFYFYVRVQKKFKTDIRDIVVRHTLQRNILLVGRSGTGKSTYVENVYSTNAVFKTSPNRVGSSSSEISRFTTLVGDFAVNFNFLDTAGLFETHMEADKIRPNDVLLDAVKQCVDNEFTKINNVFFFMSFLLVFSMAQKETCASVLAQLNSTGHVPVPCLAVPDCATSVVTVQSIEFSDGHATFSQKTSISVCFTADVLRISWIFSDDTYLRNDYKNCNDDLYNQEVGEVFVAPGWTDSTVYYEVELSPNNVLFVSKISNPYLNGSITGQPVPCAQSGITTSAKTNPSAQSWQGQLNLPYSLIAKTFNKNYEYSAPPFQVWRINLFRIGMTHNTSTCSASSCIYGAWSPTFKNPAAFHYPIYFGVLVLDS